MVERGLGISLGGGNGVWWCFRRFRRFRSVSSQTERREEQEVCRGLSRGSGIAHCAAGRSTAIGGARRWLQVASSEGGDRG